MPNIEIGQLRADIKAENPHIDIDSPFHFYYDETNNFRKFYVREEDFNYSFEANFVLGGVAYDGAKPEISGIFEGLGLQKNIKEVKLKHLAVGEFEDCLKYARLDIFLKRIIASPLYVHYTSLNILYYAIVDIVDSAIANSKVAMELGMGFAQKLKSDLYRLCLLETDEVINLFYHFKYPNIKGKDVIPFINALTHLFEPYDDDFEFHFGLTSLKQILKESMKNQTLPFIIGEDDYVLLRNFSGFYLRRIYTFKNSFHVFDKEEEIEPLINEYTLTDNGVPFKNYSFEDSKDELLIQVSDLLTGLAGKISAFVNKNTVEEIYTKIQQFNPTQLANLDNYLTLVNKSEEKNKAFLHKVGPFDEDQKLELIFGMRGKL